MLAMTRYLPITLTVEEEDTYVISSGAATSANVNISIPPGTLRARV